MAFVVVAVAFLFFVVLIFIVGKMKIRDAEIYLTKNLVVPTAVYDSLPVQVPGLFEAPDVLSEYWLP